MSDLRRKILDASIALVAEQGVRAVSFREVARRAGVSHQAPYHHFGDYHGILRAIAAEGFAELARSMREAADAAGADPMAALVEGGVAYVRFARDHVGHFRVMFQQTLVDVHDEDAPVEEVEGAHATLMRLADAARKAGYGKGLSTEKIAHLCWSLVHGFATLLTEGIIANKVTLSRKQEDRLTREVVESLAKLMGGRSRAPRGRPR